MVGKMLCLCAIWELGECHLLSLDFQRALTQRITCLEDCGNPCQASALEMAHQEPCLQARRGTPVRHVKQGLEDGQ